jgi:hypothetical protein
MSMRFFTYSAPAALPGRNPAPSARPVTIPVPVVVFFLAGLTMLLNGLDLVTFLRLTPDYGTSLEVNPIVRTVFEAGGPLAMAALKLSVIGAATLLFVCIARYGRVRQACFCLSIAAAVGMVGFLSNLTPYV